MSSVCFRATFVVDENTYWVSEKSLPIFDKSVPATSPKSDGYPYRYVSYMLRPVVYDKKLCTVYFILVCQTLLQDHFFITSHFKLKLI